MSDQDRYEAEVMAQLEQEERRKAREERDEAFRKSIEQQHPWLKQWAPKEKK